MHKGVSIAVLCLASHAAMAGTIYKCVEDGTASYHDRPCGADAVALRVQAAAAPAPDALERLARERAMLQQIEDARAARAQQQARERARVQRAALAERRRCDKLRLQHRWADEDLRRAGRAGLETAQQARIKARRQAEALAVECPA